MEEEENPNIQLLEPQCLYIYLYLPYIHKQPLEGKYVYIYILSTRIYMGES